MRVLIGGLDVGDGYDAVLVQPQHLVVRDPVQSPVDRAQLDLQEAVEFQQQALLYVVVETPDGEVLPVLQVGYACRVLF